MWWREIKIHATKAPRMSTELKTDTRTFCHVGFLLTGTLFLIINLCDFSIVKSGKKSSNMGVQWDFIQYWNLPYIYTKLLCFVFKTS